MFARSFVVTLAAIPAIPACGGSNVPPHQNPPRPTYPEQAPPQATEPTPTETAPATPTETAPAAPMTQPGTPAPAPAPAPPAQPGEPAQAKAPDYTSRWIVTKSGATCLAEPVVECPKGAPGQPMPTCNPPAASVYKCPEGMNEASLTVVRFANTTQCVVERAPVACPPNVRCNPPPPRRVDCPK
jgi:hypothetical protein